MEMTFWKRTCGLQVPEHWRWWYQKATWCWQESFRHHKYQGPIWPLCLLFVGLKSYYTGFHLGDGKRVNTKDHGKKTALMKWGNEVCNMMIGRIEASAEYHKTHNEQMDGLFVMKIFWTYFEIPSFCFLLRTWANY